MNPDEISRPRPPGGPETDPPAGPGKPPSATGGPPPDGAGALPTPGFPPDAARVPGWPDPAWDRLFLRQALALSPE